MLKQLLFCCLNFGVKVPILVFKTPKFVYEIENKIVVLGAPKLVFQTPKFVLSVL